jgi:hypothetical protein
MRNAAVYQFELALPAFIVDAGLITDELSDREVGTGLAFNDPLDQRILPESDQMSPIASYGYLQGVRTLGNQAIGALVAYDTVAADSVNVRIQRGELYALEGYAEIMLADLFCSGVPLSTLDFESDYTLRASSTTGQVYTDAIAKFDTALVIAQGNDSIMNLARVGRGRAWLDLGQFDSAAAAVQGVPDDFRYRIAGGWYGKCADQGDCEGKTYNNILVGKSTVADREGLNGLPYVSSGDPRSAVFPDSVHDPYVGTIYQQLPAKYRSFLSGPSSPIAVANGIEAQLIRAEAQLQPASSPAGPWLQTLNALRESVGLSDTTDPGTAAGRVALLFSERAYWLFLTGHRQGDLRRLLREYGTFPEFNDQSKVYPAGVYPSSGTSVYGSDVTAPIPEDEYTNPLYHGCLNHGA